MSRRAGDCFAEVEFETGNGWYRCHWGQHRARRRPEGDLQPPRHEIVDARSGKVLESRSKEVGRLVEEITGMDYDRFTRSILLAQGDFAAFLEADADQRAPILEQITGTGIYSKISIAVHERTSEERRKTALLQERMGNVVLMGEEEEKKLEAAINAGIAGAAELQQQLAAVTAGLHRVQTISSLKAQIAAIEHGQRTLADRFAQGKEALDRYDCGLRAQALIDEYTRLQHLQERMAALRTKSESLTGAMERLQQEQQAVAKEHAAACHQVQQVVAARNTENETIKAVRVLDLRLFEKKKGMEQLTASLRQNRDEHRQQMQLREALDQKLAAVVTQQHAIERFLAEHARDSLLVEHLAGFRQQLLQLQGLDKDLGRLQKALHERRAALLAAQNNTNRLQQAAETGGQTLMTLLERQENLRSEREKLAGGREPASWRAEIEQGEQRLQRLATLGELLTRQYALTDEQAAAGRHLQELQRRQQQQQQELHNLEEKRQVRQQLVAQLERNLLLTRKIHSYEEDRRHLENGAPCPLCGSTHHPWAEEQPVAEQSEEALAAAKMELDRTLGAIVVCRESLVGLAKDITYNKTDRDKRVVQLAEVDEQTAPLLGLLDEQGAGGDLGDRAVQAARLLEQGRGRLEILRERITAVERLEKTLHEVQLQREQATAHHTELLKQEQAARYACETTEKEILNLEQQSAARAEQLDRCRTDLQQQLQPLGIGDCPPQRAEELLEQLVARQQAWKARQQQKEQVAGEQVRLQAERDKLDVLLATIDKTRTQRTMELEALGQEEAGLRQQRRELYGERNPDVEEQRLNMLQQQAEARELTIRNQQTRIDKELHSLVQQQLAGKAELETLLPQQQQQEADFLGKLPAVGFTDMGSFCSALLPRQELAQLRLLKEQLEKEQTVLATRKAEQIEALQREEAKNAGQKEPAVLLEEQNTLGSHLDALQQRIGADRERLAGNRLRKKQFEEQRLALAAQQKEQERWDLLHQLIGSADGKKFRVFAQGLTFELMISHANRQLRKMNDRYILLRDPGEPLALQVIDNYQAGEIRSTRNLSGGESFLVSLALSLGLSAMASHHVRVDSLFLDEGFGSLDEEALDTALQTLSELQQDGKLIGIISHVPMLKDRIDVRIQVLPGAGGCSRLVGPGCRKVS